MKLRYPILILLLILLAYSCIAGCTGNGGNYGSSPKPAPPYVTPVVSPPPASPPRIPSTVTSFGAHFSFPAWTTQEFRVMNNPDGRMNTFVRGFGEDENHELYVLTSMKSGPDPAAATGEIGKSVPG
jgi:hypothetical protein